MFNILIDFVFYILSSLFNLIFSPLTDAFELIVVNFSSFFTGIINFFSYAFTYFDFFVKLFMIPKSLILSALSFSLLIFTFNFTIRFVYFFINLYKTLKP